MWKEAFRLTEMLQFWFRFKLCSVLDHPVTLDQSTATAICVGVLVMSVGLSDFFDPYTVPD
jgi:hypothetical protein